MTHEANARLPYPTKAQHEEAWRALALDIAARRAEIREQPDASPPVKRGELLVIGSGIETVGFSLGDEDLLKTADHVCFCVADPATVVWMKRLRPDAYDLYVLYDDKKPRYVTYMQMAEAMLHHVRNGKRVVCVFYGHPGVFVLATHRAILIARREGHAAVMRPAVCALDCLCADLGVDPCHPGMQTHEATDMLVRGRKPDTSLHVVLWQVGLIGEMGFRRDGYINRNFSVLIEYLQSAYGPDYPVTHYVASRYPTIPPLIETYRLSELHDPALQIRITGLSTFYLSPRDAAHANAEMVARLGLIKPGQNLKVASGALREIGHYGSRELRAFDDFATFAVPADYQWQANTEATNFLIELRQDVALQRLYEHAPEQALRDPRFVRMTPAERRLLATRDAGAIQVAAKGIHKRDTANHALITALLLDRRACADLLRQRRASPEADRKDWLAGYAARRGLPFVPETLGLDLSHLRRHALLPWTGVYAAATQSLLITVLGNARGSGGVVYVNRERVRGSTYKRGVLEWRAGSGNAHSGFLRFEAGSRGRRALGQIWGAEQAHPNDGYLEAVEIDPDRGHLGPRAGRFLRGEDLASLNRMYTLRAVDGRATQAVDFEYQEGTVKIAATPVHIERRDAGRISWSAGPSDAREGMIRFLCNPFTNLPELYGHVKSRAGHDVPCVGAAVGTPDIAPRMTASTVPDWVYQELASLSSAASDSAPPFLWQKWERHHLTSRVVNTLGVRL